MNLKKKSSTIWRTQNFSIEMLRVIVSDWRILQEKFGKLYVNGCKLILPNTFCRAHISILYVVANRSLISNSNRSKKATISTTMTFNYNFLLFYSKNNFWVQKPMSSLFVWYQNHNLVDFFGFCAETFSTFYVCRQILLFVFLVF